jgi:hypothetical protein
MDFVGKCANPLALALIGKASIGTGCGWLTGPWIFRRHVLIRYGEVLLLEAKTMSAAGGIYLSNQLVDIKLLYSTF